MRSPRPAEPQPAEADGSATVERMLRLLPGADVAAMAALLADIGAAVAGEEDLDRILVLALTRLRRFVPFTGGSIALVDGDELAVMAAVGPFADAALLAVKLLKKGELKVYNGYPHGMATTHADVINADLLAFLRA